MAFFMFCRMVFFRFLGCATPEQWQSNVFLAILDGAPLEPDVVAPEPSLSAVPTSEVVEIVEDELEKSRSSDGSFAKVSAVRISDDENDSEYSLLLPEESASYGGA